MNSNDLGQQLHDKATRNVPLTSEEQGELQGWYAQQDAAESQALQPAAGEADLSRLRRQVDAALGQLGVVTRQIQEAAAANATLREELAVLRRRAARLPAQQPA